MGKISKVQTKDRRSCTRCMNHRTMAMQHFKLQRAMAVVHITGNLEICLQCKVYRPMKWLTSRHMSDNSSVWLGFSSERSDVLPFLYCGCQVSHLYPPCHLDEC